MRLSCDPVKHRIARVTERRASDGAADDDQDNLTRAQRYELSEDVGRNPPQNPTIGDVIAARFNRRDLIKGALGVAAIAATVSPLALAAATGPRR